MKYENIGKAIGHLVDEKNKHDGDAFNKSNEFLKILYPNGISTEQYRDMLAVVRRFDKLMRVANGIQGYENPVHDICGYAILKSEVKDN